MKPNKIFLVRHGESEGNVNKKIYAEKPDYAVRLTERGRSQSQIAGSFIKEKSGNSSIGVYYSPFLRTIDTLNSVVETLGTNYINKDYVREDARLREQEWYSRFPLCEYNLEAEKDRLTYGTFFYRFNSGESNADVYDRMSTFISDLKLEFNNRDFPSNLILVTHGMAMRVFLMRWFNKTASEFETWSNPKNCELWMLTHNNNGEYDFPFNSLKTHVLKHSYQVKVNI